MSVSKWKSFFAIVCLTILMGGLLTGCSDDDNDDDNGGDDDTPSGLTDSQINDQDGQLSATIRRTTGGVPHIKADNLESAAFGSGYVQAEANVCIIADTILQVRSQRARFYGPGPGNINVITDFSIKALGLMSKAEARFDTLPAASQALLRGFAAGYNKYVAETDASELPGKCLGQPWVRAITPEQLYGYYRLISLYGSGYLFTTGATFAAAPPGASPAPAPVMAARMEPADQRIVAALDTDTRYQVKTDYTDYQMGSNGWGIGGELTENGRGALLANPHYPYTGNRRFYQQHITVPGVYDVNGGSLIGFVLPQIGFNQNVAWTHTVTTSNHFTFYQLQLAAGDSLSYIKDGEQVPITSETFQIQVANGTPTPTTLEKTFYYSEYGPIINANAINGALPAWGDPGSSGNPVAFTYRDAGAVAAEFAGIIQYLQMGRASNLAEFKTAYQPCGNVIFVNTMYADAEGNAFYIDGSAVPNLSQDALAAFDSRMAASPLVAGLAASGIILLDGSTSRDDWVEGQCSGIVGYDGFPKLTRQDYVQNSNDSYWATNLDTLDALADANYSPLFGPVDDTLSPRTRMGLKMITNRSDPGLSSIQPAGDDGKFTGKEIIEMLYSNRAYYPETLLDDLLARCESAGTTPVSLPDGGSRSIASGCSALAGWDGVYNTDSTGAHVFRVFIGHYDNRLPEAFTVPFDPTTPATTPSTPPEPTADPSQDPMLQALAQGLEALEQAGIAPDAALGIVQYQQQSGGAPPGGTAVEQGPRLPWHGNQNVEGGFNIVRPYIGDVDDGTRFPRVSPDESDILPDTGNLTAGMYEGWRIAYGTSWHFGLMFTDQGPEAWGLLSYSQSDDPSSPHFADQDERYSEENYRRLLYAEQEIASDPNLTTTTITAQTGTNAD